MTGLFTEKGKPVCAVKTASGTLTITSSGKYLMGFLGRSNLTVSETPAKFSKACPVLWRVAVPEWGAGIVRAWKTARSGKPLDDFLKGMERSRGVKIKVLDEQPDELVENKPRECQSGIVLNGLSEYRSGVKIVAETVSETKGLSESLMRMRLPEGMWGIKEVKKKKTRQEEIEDMERELGLREPKPVE